MLVRMGEGALFNVANVNCPKCEGRGYWYDVKQVTAENGVTTCTLIYNPFCDCVKEMKEAEVLK